MGLEYKRERRKGFESLNIKLKAKSAYMHLKKNYGFVFCGLLLFLLMTYILIKRDYIYLPINDSLDSNVPIYKMIADNDLFWKRTGSIPFLGGVLDRSNYRVQFSVEAWMYMLMPAFNAYIVVFFLKLILSSLGFYFLARLVRKYEKCDIDLNIWLICGFIYGMLGQWQHASLGFASLPWWVFLIYLIYKEKKWYYVPLPLIFVVITSFAMLAIFIIAYLIAGTLLIAIQKKKINGYLLAVCLELLLGYFITNSNHIRQGTQGSSDTIKSLAVAKYVESIREDIQKLFDSFVYGQYHAGQVPLRYIVIPICCIALVYFNVQLIKKKNTFVVLPYDICFAMIIVNTFMYAFDNNYHFRNLIHFASGFSFSRFTWLNPFLWMVCFAIICSYFYNKKAKLRILVGALFIINMLVIVLDNPDDVRFSMYNIFHLNYNKNISEETRSFTWHEYYSEDLFQKIKNDIDYNGEWSIAYGFEPSVLQFNGIATLDGYYSNLDLQYYEKFTQLIQPLLNIDNEHRDYWSRTSGRAYVYSTEWDYFAPKNTNVKRLMLYINPEIFNEMNGKYVFSRVEIVNYRELGFTQCGSWESHDSPYTIYVYKN